MNYAAHYLQDADGSLKARHGVLCQEGSCQVFMLEREIASTIFFNGIIFPFITPEAVTQLSIQLLNYLRDGQVADIVAFVATINPPTRRIDSQVTTLLALQGADLLHLTLNNKSRWIVLSL